MVTYNNTAKEETCQIVPTEGATGLEIDCVASVDNVELERTPGAVAVSEVRGKGSGEVNSFPDTSLINSFSGAVCGAWAVIAECSSHLHHFAKKIVCGKEWCPDCGQNRSPAHNRRIARVLPKALQIASMGYFVIEFPDRYRKVVSYAYSKRALQAASKAIVDTLAGKRCGRKGRVGGYFNRGLLRWHWFGDEVEGKYNPHANVLVDAGYIANEQLETIKAALRSALHCDDLIVNYSFADTPGMMFHKVAYVTRATFLKKEWSPYMAAQLFNFRNMRWWGKWAKVDEVTGKLPAESIMWSVEQAEAEGEDAEGLLSVSKLSSGVCPDCGLPLEVIGNNPQTGAPVHWSRPVDSAWLVAWNATEIAHSGYYRIPHKEWDGGERSPGVLMRQEIVERKDKLGIDMWLTDFCRRHRQRLINIAERKCSTFGVGDDDGMV